MCLLITHEVRHWHTLDHEVDWLEKTTDLLSYPLCLLWAIKRKLDAFNFWSHVFIDLASESIYLLLMAECRQRASHCVLCALSDVGTSLSPVMGPKQRHRGLNTNTKNTSPPGSLRQVQAHPFLRHLSSCFYSIAPNGRWKSQIKNQWNSGPLTS